MTRVSFQRSRWLVPVVAGMAGVLISATAFAQSSVSSSDGNPPSLLQQLSADTQRVYERVKVGIVIVKLPTPRWLEQLNAQDQLLRKWGSQLSPDVREQLRLEQQQARAEEIQRVGAVATSQPMVSATQPTPTTEATILPVGSTTQPVAGGLMFPGRTFVAPPVNLVLVATGLLFDGDGHAVIPMYVEREALGAVPLRVIMGDGTHTTAKFLGSDRKTNLTILQLENHAGQPVTISPGAPADGQLVVDVMPEGGAKLVVWTNLHPEPGLIVMPDASIAGFSMGGQFLAASKCKPIVEQIVATGEVRRSVLGVRLQEIAKDDAFRQQVPELGIKPAYRVLEIVAGSAAEKGGLKVGDVITAIAGEPVGDLPMLAAAIGSRVGKTELRVLRGTESVRLLVDLERE